MIDADSLVKMYRTNIGVVKWQTDGLTHEDSLLQLPFRGNCLNWVLGHIMASRSTILKLVGAEPVWTEEVRARYVGNTEPIIEDGEGVVRLEQILADLEESQTRLMDALSVRTVEELNQPTDDGKGTVADRLAFFFFHESYHTGQTEYLRQLAGKNDKVI